MAILKKHQFDLAFEISLVLKGFYGFFEIIAGLVIFSVSQTSLSNFIIYLTRGELFEDKGDLLANYFVSMAQSLSTNTQFFIASYLLIYGVVKIILVAGMLREKLWAFPIALITLSIFIFYQVYRFLSTHSLFLLTLIIIDIFTTWLIWYKFRSLWREKSAILISNGRRAKKYSVASVARNFYYFCYHFYFCLIYWLFPRFPFRK